MASLAHLPTSLIERASEILDVYEHKGKKQQTFTQTSLFLDFDNTEPATENEIAKKLNEIDPLKMTPIEALNFLYEITNELKGKK